MDSEFEGRVVLITGGASGIGRRVAELLGERGARLALFDMNADALKAVREEFARKDWAVVTTVGDSSVVEDAEAFVRNAVEAYGRVDMLLNGAAIVVRKNLLDTTPEEWRRVIDVDLNGYFYILRAAVPEIRKAGGGSIVQIATIAAHIGFGYPSYTAAKGGVLSMTRELAGELAPYGIRINSVSPGPTETGINVDTMGDAKIKAALVATTPSGRTGKPDDIARAVLFLLSPASEYINGADLIVDGGMSSKIHFGSVAATFQSYHGEARARA
jgi:NAD(P)-dependent dehydrogenase (short-subunit alcohol dehydrogenase family)